MNKLNWFTELFLRLKGSTPEWFWKIIYFGIALGSIGGGIILAKEQLPQWLVDWADNMVQIGVVAGIVASTAVKNPQNLKK